MREEILHLLQRGFSTEDITLFFSRFLDQNSNHLGRSTQSLNVSPSHCHYATQSLPRPTRRSVSGVSGNQSAKATTPARDAAGVLHRPASVDEVQLWHQQCSSSDGQHPQAWDPRLTPSASKDSVDSGSSGDNDSMKRTESFMSAMAAPVIYIPRNRRPPDSSASAPVGDEETGAATRLLTRTASDEPRTERSRASRPGFIQRMLQKRKSFHEKPITNGKAVREREESVGERDPSARREGKDSSVGRKVSIKGIFKRKTSVPSMENKRDAEPEPGSPPIATFLNDDDIGPVPSSPDAGTLSAAGRRARSDSQLRSEERRGYFRYEDGYGVTSPGGVRREDCILRREEGAGEVVLRRPPAQLPAGGANGVRTSERFSGEYSRISDRYSGDYSTCDSDMSSSDNSSLLVPGVHSPSGSSSSSRTLESRDTSFSRTSFEDAGNGVAGVDVGRALHRAFSDGAVREKRRGDVSIGRGVDKVDEEGREGERWREGGEGDVSRVDGEYLDLDRTQDSDATLLASPRSLDRTRVPQDWDRTPRPQPSSSSSSFTSSPSPWPPGEVALPPRPTRKPSMGRVDMERLAAMVTGEITSSNSNDSGIQHDVTISSNESLTVRIPPEAVGQYTHCQVKLRNSPSPKQERPKSDFTVRWADLLEQVKETSITYRKEGGKIRQRPRPKSDLGGSSLLAQAVSGRTALGSLTQPYRTGPGTGGGQQQQQPQYDSVMSLVELRRSGSGRGRHDAATLQNARLLAKARRMSTPQPIKIRNADRVAPAQPLQQQQQTHQRTQRQAGSLVRSHSMPDSLDHLQRKKNYFSLIGYYDLQSSGSQNSGGEDSSSESEFSVDYQQEKSLSTRASRVTLATLDQMIEEENLTYAEALWDHVTMDPEELGFRAGELVRVTDMADKHWWYGNTQHRDGWFPATFVRLRVNQEDLEAELTLGVPEEEEEEAQRQPKELQPKAAPSSQSNKSHLRSNVVREIVTAEAEYVKHLRDVIEGYLKQARKRPEMFPVEKCTVIFSNIEVIYEFATKLLADLQSKVNKDNPHLTEFGQCFLNKTHEFEIYSEYCNNHPAACDELRDMYRVKRYRHFFEACRLLQEMTEIPLEGFLLTPVQKICKYHLQLAELLKYTPQDHPDHSYVQQAVDAMKRIAKLVNERKRKMESIETLAEWQLLVDDWEGPDILDDSSELIYSGELNKINANGWSQERYFFLFDHQLVYCKKDLLKKNSFGYKGRINMDHSIIISLPDGRDSQYSVTVRNGFKIHDQQRDKWYLVVAKTPQIKQRWLKAFSDERRRVHDDMVNNFNIPAHLKQTIVTSLKQKFHATKSKGKVRASRSGSMRASTKTSSWVATNATLPRTVHKSISAPSQHSSKFMTFLLGGKRKG